MNRPNVHSLTYLLLRQFRQSCIRNLLIGTCIVAVLPVGCASRSSNSRPVATVNEQRTHPAGKVYQKFAAANPTMISRIGNMESVVRMATTAEILDDRYKLGALFPLEGAGSLALGLVAPPMYASALVAGGVLLIPLGSYLYIHDKRVWDAITGAMIDVEFTRAVDGALRDRLRILFGEESAPKLKMELIVQRFGIVESESGYQYCLVVSAELVLNRKDGEVTREWLNISQANGSEDAPPPQCAGLERFAERKARLVRDTLALYAETLAAMAAERVSGGC
jgi:hypothetical protein